MQDMIQIKIAVEGMKAEIIKAFNVEEISASIKQATEKAVDEFDMAKYIESTIGDVFYQAKDLVIVELSRKYGEQWANDLSSIIDKKILQALRAIEGE